MGCCMGCAEAMKKRNTLFLILFFVVAIVGLFFIVYGAVNYQSTEVRKDYDYSYFGATLGIDQYSAAVASVYDYQGKEKGFRLVKSLECFSRDAVANQGNKTAQIVRGHLDTCLVNISQGLPKAKKMPIFLSLGVYDEKHDVKDVFKESVANSAFKLAGDSFSFGAEDYWVTSNYFQSAVIEKNPDLHGIVRVGMSSFVTSYQVDKSSNPVKVGGETMYLQNFDDQCLGINKLNINLMAFLARGNLKVVDWPCGLVGSPVIVRWGDWKGTCGVSTDELESQVTYNGQGDGGACVKAIGNFVDTYCSDCVFDKLNNQTLQMLKDPVWVNITEESIANDMKEICADAASDLDCFYTAFTFYTMQKLEEKNRIVFSTMEQPAAYGLFYNNQDQLYDNTKWNVYKVLLQSHSLIGLIVFGCLLLIFGLVLFVITCMIRPKNQEYQEAEISEPRLVGSYE